MWNDDPEVITINNGNTKKRTAETLSVFLSLCSEVVVQDVLRRYSEAVQQLDH